MNKEIIKKAEKGGWNKTSVKYYLDCTALFEIEKAYFEHSFLKAFFGKKKLPRTNWYLWQFYAQQLILKKDPIKYLEEFIH